jgi:hypothetical protein
MELSDELLAVANSQGRGHLKPWKACSIAMTVTRIPQIVEDRSRLRAYVSNCLEMEGFGPAGIDAVTDAIFAARAK